MCKEDIPGIGRTVLIFHTHGTEKGGGHVPIPFVSLIGPLFSLKSTITESRPGSIVEMVVINNSVASPGFIIGINTLVKFPYGP